MVCCARRPHIRVQEALLWEALGAAVMKVLTCGGYALASLKGLPSLSGLKDSRHFLQKEKMKGKVLVMPGI